MAMTTYTVRLTGKTPLIMHRDNIEWADHLDDWKNDPENKRRSRAGDDRTPAWRWLGGLYHDGKHLAIPQENIQRALMEGGAMVPVPGGRSGKTFKAQTQSGMMSVDPFWRFTSRGQSIDYRELEEALKDEEAFPMHLQAARDRGFDLMVKRARVGQSKHIRVRPVFAQWALEGVLAVWDEQLTADVLAQVIRYAGQYKGIGDWRPGGKTPGPFGTFEGELGRE